MNPSHELGEEAEREAERHLRSLGCRILARRWRCPLGELDLVVREGEEIVFVEVKARSGSSFGPAELAVDGRKRKRIVRAALSYVEKERVSSPLRFDVVVLQGGELRHIRAAFSAEGYTR